MQGWNPRVRASYRSIGSSFFTAARRVIPSASIKRAYALAAAPLELPIIAFGQAQMETPGGFQVDPQGGASYAIGIQTPPGTAGMMPVIGLQYHSGAGNGLVGNSWGIRGLNAITRCGRTIDPDGVSSGVHFDSTDKFCMDGSVLIVVNGGAYGGAGTEYRTDNDNFTRVISYGGTLANGPDLFVAHKKSGQFIEFGNTVDSRVEAQGKAVIRLWAVNKVADRAGNYMSVTYPEDNANGDHRPARIDYTGNTTTGLAPYNSVRFVYQARTDISPSYVSGSSISNQQRLSNIQTFAGAALVKDYRLTYDCGGIGATSRLLNLAECDAAGTCLPPTSFAWQGSTGAPGYAAAVNWLSPAS